MTSNGETKVAVDNNPACHAETHTYNPMELMICLAARCLEDGSSVVVGTGAPCAAAMLAQKTSAPNIMVMFEAGGVGPILPTMPISVGDSRTFHRGIMASSMLEIMEACQRGMVDYCFLGGAQIDMYGNINSTVIGDFDKPRVRFPGSGGANDLASLCWKTRSSRRTIRGGSSPRWTSSRHRDTSRDQGRARPRDSHPVQARTR